MTLLPIAFAGGSFVFLAFVVVLFFVVVFGFYTRRGSGINQRPTDGRGGSPGAKGPSEITTAGEDGEERTIGTHGTDAN